MWIFLSFVFLLFVLFIVSAVWSAVEDHREEVIYARLTNRPSNVEMIYTDTKLAEFNRGDKGKVLSTKEVIKVVNGYPHKYFKVVFENGKELLVHVSCIKWISYIEEQTNTEKNVNKQETLL